MAPSTKASAHLLSEVNRVAFARARLYDSWDKRWFFDESYFNLYRHGNRYWVRVTTDDAMSMPKLTDAQEKVSVGVAAAIHHGKQSALAFLPKSWKAADLVHAFDTVIYPSLIGPIVSVNKMNSS